MAFCSWPPGTRGAGSPPAPTPPTPFPTSVRFLGYPVGKERRPYAWCAAVGGSGVGGVTAALVPRDPRSPLPTRSGQRDRGFVCPGVRWRRTIAGRWDSSKLRFKWWL